MKKMKKHILTGVTTAALLAVCTGTALAVPSVVVNDQTLALEQPPVIVDSRTLVPMRAIFEALGCEVNWYADTQTVMAQKDLTYLSLEIGSNILYASNANITLDVPAQIIQDRTMVPLRAVSEALKADVTWDAATETVTIRTADAGTYTYTMEKYTASNQNISVDMAYPQFTDGSNSILTNLNSQLAAAARTRANAFQQVFQQDEDMAEIASEMTCTAEERYAVTYNTSNYVSILFQNVQNTGGAHPMTLRNSIVYDMTSGKSLALTDILNGDQAAIDQLILDGFMARVAAEPDAFFPEAEQYLQEAIAAKSYNYYLTSQGLTIYFQLYDIAPYAAGFQEYTLPFSQSDAFKLSF